MKQLEINDVIREINEKAFVLVELEEELKNYPNIRQIERQLTNPDNEWQYLYHLENNNVLKDWLEVLSEIYYQVDFKEPQELKPILEKLEFVSQKMLKVIENSNSFEDITSNDLKFASDLSKYLHQYKNFIFLTSEVSEFKKEISRIKIELKDLEVNKKMLIMLKIF